MHPMMKKFVDDGFMPETVANYIVQAIERKESIICAGHRSTGIRPFMATLMMISGKTFKAQQVKNFDSLENACDYFMIPGIDGLDFEELMYQAHLKPASMISLKEPEHPFSLFKILKKATKEHGPSNKIYHIIECDKEDGVPYVKKVTKVSQDENGKTLKEDFQF